MTAATSLVLRVSDDLSLPIDYVTKTAAIFAQRRKGKTYTASVIAEELVAVEIPWVALDPTGAWWGLRSSADGERAGLPVIVLGGQHGDLPLERGAGRFVADLVVDYPGYYVLDLSLLDSRAAEREFATAFAERLYRRKMQPGMDFPLHLFVDEADMFVPQEREVKDDTRLLGAFQAIVRRGGLHGLGTTLISQRPALVNKSVLTQLDLLILLRLIAGNDQDAVDKNYISRSSTKEQRAALMDSLASLKIGQAWLFEPGAEPDPILELVRIRERDTFNSSATPRPGEKRVEPRVLADVDLDALREQMADAVERAKDDDPAELRRRLATAEKKAKDAEADAHDLAAFVDEVGRASDGPHVIDELLAVYRVAKSRVGFSCDVVDEALALRDAEPTPVPVYTIGDLDAVWKLVQAAREVGTSLSSVSDDLVARLGETTRPLASAILEAKEAAERNGAPRADRTVREQRASSQPAAPRDAGSVGTSVAVAPAPGRAPEAVRPADGVTVPQQKILDALAWWEAIHVLRPTLGQVAFVVGNHARTKGFTNNVSALSGAGYVERGAGVVSLTVVGATIARAPMKRPTEPDLQQMIYRQVGPKRSEILAYLIARHDVDVPLEELAEHVGSHPRSKGFTNNVSSLSGLGLVVRSPGRVRASDLCFLV